MLEVDHFAHHHHADAHPEDAARQQQVAGTGGEEDADIGRRCQVDQAHHGDGQRADDAGRRLPAAVAQHAGHRGSADRDHQGALIAHFLISRDTCSRREHKTGQR